MKTTDHLDAETLAAFAEGNLKRNEIAPVLTHLDQCAACRETVAAVNDTLPRERRNWPWLSVAAAIVIAGALAFMFLGRGAPELAELLPADERTVEARLSGGFAWAPYRGTARATGAGDSSDPKKLQLLGAAGKLVEEADQKQTAAAQHSAGVALVLIEQPQNAAARLQKVTEQTPDDPKAWSDLAAAQYASALRLGRASLYPEALASADRALRLQPELAEALFNRALILERMGLTGFARDAWTRYLSVDATSKWAGEARAHLEKLPKTTSQSEFKLRMPKLEAGNDPASVTAIVNDFRQQSRTYAESDWIGRWGEAVARGDAKEAERLLSAARLVGDALQRTSGEALLAEVVRSIDAAGEEKRTKLAAAYALYRQGRITYAKRKPLEAEPQLREAASRLAANDSPMALVARYYASNARFDRSDVGGARRELERLLDESDASPSYIALGAQIRWQLALCRMTEGGWSEALPLIQESANGFRRLGERANLGFVQAMAGDALLHLGRPDESWAALVESLALLSAEGLDDRLLITLAATSRMELQSERLQVARSLMALEVAANRDNQLMLVNALVREAVLHAQLGDDAAAERDVEQAKLALDRIEDRSLRARMAADVLFAGGAAALRNDPRRARVLLQNAAIELQRHEAPLFLPHCHLLQATANVRLGDRAAAARNLDDGIAALQRLPSTAAGPAAGSGLIKAAALFDEAIRLALDRGDTAAAFTYAERARLGNAGAASVREVQQRLAGSGAMVLEIVVMPAETIVIAITADDASVARTPMARAAVETLAERFARADDADAANALHALIVAPYEPRLARARTLIVVPDPILASVPFAALRGANGLHLIERMPIAMAASASSLTTTNPRPAPRSIVAVALPAGESATTVALPETSREIDDVAALYPTATTLAGDRATLPAFHQSVARTDVIHVSGHTERQRGIGEAAFVFAGERHRIAAHDAGTMRLAPEAVVVLAACETLRTPRAPGSAAISLGQGFLATGASDVIGTLAEIPDADAARLFREIHRQLARGVAPAEAVRRAQLAALKAATRGESDGSWRAIATLTRTIPRV